ncbi:MAG: ribosome maturation factor RimP [Clostridiales bacterium]|nr:ribosome maturation factor RimP [Clostridiales bacterium]
MASGAKSGKKPNTVAVVTELVTPAAQRMGLTIWDVRFEKEGSSWFLRVLVDKETGLTMDECEAYSREVSALLDEADPIDQSYFLEVGSPGVERELTRDWHFEEYLGAPVNVRLIRPVDGVRDFQGELLSFENGEIALLLDDEIEMKFQKSEAAYVRLVDDFDYSMAEIEE